MRAVAQKPHPIPQPAWLEMQSVSRSRAPASRSNCGMRTLSIAAGRASPSPGRWKRSFRVPSAASAMETLAFGYGLVEAPRIDGAGNLYFSDAIDGGVYRRAPDGAVSVVVPKRRGVGGLALHADGGVVISGKDVSHVRDGVTRILLTVEGALGFNDLTTDAAGHVFVGSLRSPALQNENRVPGELWRVEGAGRAVEVYRDVAFANG